MGEYIGEHSIHKKKKDTNLKSYGPRMISDKEEEDILKTVSVKQEGPEEPLKQPTGDPTNLLATTARPKVKDILTGSGIT